MSFDPGIDKVSYLWDQASDWRLAQMKRWNYYKGVMKIVNEGGEYADGTSKSEIVTNWIAYITNRFVGALTSIPWSLTKKETGEDDPVVSEANENNGPKIYSDISEANELDSVNTEAFRRAFVQGYGPELHEFIDGEIKISNGIPVEWLPIYDTQTNDLVGAINRIDLDTNSVIGDDLLEESVSIITLYNDSQIITWELSGSGKDWELLERVDHFYGRVPVVFWRVNTDRESQISDALMGQNDEYNEIDSGSGDDIRLDTDAMLVLPGLDAQFIQDNIETIRQNRVLPWTVDADDKSLPFYLIRNNDVIRINDRLNRTREHIHVMGEVPDFEEIVGSTGATSGIALKLKFLPMIHSGESMIDELISGLRERVELINSMLTKQKAIETPGTIIEDVVYNIKFSLPVNRLEEWTSISALDGIVSHRTQLELLSDIKDPEQELKRIEEEGLEGDSTIPGLDADEGDQSIAQQQQVAEGAIQVEAGLQGVSLEDTAQSAINLLTKGGALDAALKQS